MKLNSVNTYKNETVKRCVYQTCLKIMYETFMKGIFVINHFLFKVVSLIEVSLKFIQEKSRKFIFSVYAVIAILVN